MNTKLVNDEFANFALEKWLHPSTPLSLKALGLAVVFFFTFAGSPAKAQEYVTIYGYVTDESNGEAITNASVTIQGTYTGTTSNKQGFFSLKFFTDEEFTVVVRYMGYEQATAAIRKDMWPQVLLDVRLSRKVIELKEVVFEQPVDRSRLESTEMGVTRLQVENVKRIPMIGGETDLLKIMHVTPGVMQGQELSNGMYVRGGSVDQNLFLLDGVTVYNPNHLFGFFSVFNSDALKEVELMKGSIPAEYGGRLSSVMNMSMKEGNREKFEARGGVSLVTSRLTVEGPIGSSKKGSYLISGRRTYIDPALSIGSQQSGSGEKTIFYFYDLNLKTNYDLSPNDRLFLSGYFGRDNMDLSQEDSDGGDGKDVFRLRWGNAAYNLRYHRIWSPSFFTNASVIYSDYRSDYSLSGDENIQKTPSIADVQTKIDAEWHPHIHHVVRFGGSFVKHWFKAFSGIQETEDDKVVELESTEGRWYASHDWNINDKLRSNLGLHAAYFHMGDYWQIDPRVSLRYRVHEDLALKAAYTRMHQFIHVLSSLNLSNAGDIYYPSTDYLKPERSNQWTLGMTHILSRHWEWDVELYYKTMERLPLFRQNFSSADPSQLKDEVVLGRGWAYGLETGFQKNIGRATGWINYTFSKAYRKYAEKNHGKSFTPKFDRTHQLNAVLDYRWKEKWKLGATFVLASGQPITLPKQRYFLNDQDGRNENFQGVIDYGQINSHRLPWYNRLDVSLTYMFKGWGANWELFVNVYNIYNYANPLWVEYQEDKGEFEQTSIGMLPTAGIAFRF